jgi:hypothetical protein
VPAVDVITTVSAVPRTNIFIRLPPAVARWRYAIGIGANVFERQFDSASYTVGGSHTVFYFGRF